MCRKRVLKSDNLYRRQISTINEIAHIERTFGRPFRYLLFSQVGVVGLGLMGHGVAQVTAMSPDYSVVAFDGSQNAIDSGRKRIDESVSKMLDRKIKKGALSKEDAAARKDAIMSRVSYASDMSALADCDLVIEAITEKPEIKLPLFKDLARITPPSCILASNTSSLSIMVGAVGRGWQAWEKLHCHHLRRSITLNMRSLTCLHFLRKWPSLRGAHRT